MVDFVRSTAFFPSAAVFGCAVAPNDIAKANMIAKNFLIVICYYLL